MKQTLRVLPEAEAELLSAGEWYEGKQPNLGIEFIDALDRAFARILQMPESAPIWREGYPYRMYSLRRFPYEIFYTVEPDYVEVTAVAHAKRRPGYWMGR
ncbi:MAG: type II toxin-antitoxin system RelE/ParE family toxin [Proteobacteria bacterium]|nr:type II toxin-antitoxin system RelE/ParE family toxin [Pseudomonadota bacterium]